MEEITADVVEITRELKLKVDPEDEALAFLTNPLVMRLDDSL